MLYVSRTTLYNNAYSSSSSSSSLRACFRGGSASSPMPLLKSRAFILSIARCRPNRSLKTANAPSRGPALTAICQRSNLALSSFSVRRLYVDRYFALLYIPGPMASSRPMCAKSWNRTDTETSRASDYSLRHTHQRRIILYLSENLSGILCAYPASLSFFANSGDMGWVGS